MFLPLPPSPSTTSLLSAQHSPHSPPFPPPQSNQANKTPIGDGSPSFNTDKITDNKDVKKWIDSYLDVGEWVMDKSVSIAAASGYFKHVR